MRRTALVLLAAALLAPVAAQAAPKPPPCRGADPAGDAKAPERDIRCVDIATSAKDLTLVLRLAAPPGGDPAGGAVGESWVVSFIAGGMRVAARLDRAAVTGGYRWSLTVGDAEVPVVGIAGRDGTLRWTSRGARDLLNRPRLVISTWAAQTMLAGSVSDDSASGRTAKG